ncbi:alpha/beta fold hydrolase [Clostridium sp. A1-XYC3]|uniref:Alpha/beta fold hydrolase n=1 Tax=Clostridium tanneri TaxID=3037988 RepID=A0ABU4JNR3_9CLOT|nr:alpha/beta fold hydrolase [Clostridium sp. A1-XYC3]MDW8799781.1 alpha/beta fold hydrolase [Clostridium sp. A1-XYC3]
MNLESLFMDSQQFDKEYSEDLKAVFFRSKGKQLIGTMYLAQGKGPHPTVNLLHGFPGYEQNMDLAQILRRIGYNVFTFHYRGSWGCEGEYSFSNVLEDVEASIEFLKSEQAFKLRVDRNNIILIGHSMGGFAALITAAKKEEIKKVVSIAGFNAGAFAESIYGNSEEVLNYIDEWQENVQPLKGTSSQALVKECLDNKKEFNITNYVEELSKHSLLLIAGVRDKEAPIRIHHTSLINALREKNNNCIKEVVFNSDHAFSNSRTGVAKAIVSWLEEG